MDERFPFLGQSGEFAGQDLGVIQFFALEPDQGEFTLTGLAGFCEFLVSPPE